MSQNQWHIAEDGQSKGPYEQAEVEQMIAQGDITPATLVWRDGFAQWQKAADTQLAGLLEPKTHTEEQAGQWYVMRQERRLGPLNRQQALEAVDSVDTMVWHSGQNQWQKAGQSPLAPYLAMMRPQYSPVTNNVVWIAAFSPLLGTLLAAILLYNSLTPEDISMLQQGVIPQDYTWIIFVPLLLQTALGALDLMKLKNAGHSVGGMAVCMLLIFPLYLFLRARKLGNNYAYLIVYLLCIGLLLLT